MTPPDLTTIPGGEGGKKLIYDSPFKLMVVIVLAIIFAEATEEALVRYDLEPEPSLLFDVLYMVISLFPVLYFFIFKPQLIRIEDQKRTESALRISQEQLWELSSQVMVIQEQERKKVAMELHDDVGQSVNIVKLQLSSFRKKRLMEGQVEDGRDIDLIAGQLDGIIEKIRRLSRELSPGMLDDLGLGAALRGMFNDFRRYYKINGEIEIVPESIDSIVSPQNRIFIYRIFQEAMSNIVKHAMAGTVSVHIDNDEGGVSFSIEDDGRGFDLGEAAADFGSKRGLAIMHERARMIGGKLHIWSKKGEGTRISLFVPENGGGNDELIVLGDS